MIRIFFVFSIAVALGACSGSPGQEEEGDYRLYEFGVRGSTSQENFKAKTSNPALIAQLEAQLALPAADRLLFPSGPIEAGDDGYNAPWGWHFVADQWELAEMAIELCDGTPTLVEEDLGYWLDTVGQFCPWGGYVLRKVNP